MQWKRDPRKKPLVLQGGRQTGKTWILRDFGEKNYDITIYINMETERSAADFLSVPREPEEILLFLESYANKPIRQEGTLLILDNFQCVAQGPSILGGLNLDFPGYHIAVIEKGGGCFSYTAVPSKMDGSVSIKSFAPAFASLSKRLPPVSSLSKGTTTLAIISPVSSPALIFMIVTPDSFSPSMTAC